MNIEQQLSNLELSKKLKKLGVKQDSVWYWVQRYYLDAWILSTEKFSNTHRNEISAFTVAELGEMIPFTGTMFNKKFIKKTIFKSMDIFQTTILWHCAFCLPKHNPVDIHDKTEANARAKCLIYLIENDIIKVDKI